MMKLDVAATNFALGESRSFSFLVSPESLDMGGDMPCFCGDIHVEGTVMNTGLSFRVTGVVSACRSFVCDRCLAQGQRKETLDFSEDYAKTPGEADESSYDGDAIVIDDLVRDTLLVAEVCGQNLNEGICECDAFVPDPRLAALESLLKNN